MLSVATLLLSNAEIPYFRLFACEKAMKTGVRLKIRVGDHTEAPTGDGMTTRRRSVHPTGLSVLLRRGTVRPRGAKSSAGHAPVMCIGCISPCSSLSLPFPFHRHSRASRRARARLRASVCSPTPLSFGTAAPRVPLSLSLSLSLSRSLFLRSGLSSLSRARSARDRSFVRRGPLLYRRYAPTTASREPTGERVATSARASVRSRDTSASSLRFARAYHRIARAARPCAIHDSAAERDQGTTGTLLE